MFSKWLHTSLIMLVMVLCHSVGYHVWCNEKDHGKHNEKMPEA